ncbi:MAG: hypothetical protein VYC39_18685 [Myxococcota bacterium]|nr:hypothetical protein [Myxococcota bacterium]
MTKVFFTWLGPPQEKNKTIPGVTGEQRADLFGINLVSKSRFHNDPPPEFTLCVLEKFETAFRAELPDYVDVMPVETSFTSANFQSIVMTQPSLDNIDACVDYIIRETLQVRGKGYDASLLPYKKLAFVKDLWSLFVVWKFGGYHLDSGCYPFPSGTSLNFAEPTTFMVPALFARGTQSTRECRIRFQTSPDNQMRATIRASMLLLERSALKDQVTVLSNSTPLQQLLDVWLVACPAGHAGARKALELYIRGWFDVQKWLKDKPDTYDPAWEPSLYLELIVSAVQTAVTQGEDTLLTREQVDASILDAYTEMKVIRSIGIKKVGFKSHR